MQIRLIAAGVLGAARLLVPVSCSRLKDALTRSSPAKVMEEMGKKMEGNKDMPMPFDMKRMAYGGFKVEVEG